jgi:alpha-galactosidase
LDGLESLNGLEGKQRQGITECKFIGAHYQMWQKIIACTLSHGGCGFVDSCASGGGRNDLESMRLGVPLLRSDSDRTTVALRLSMTSAFNRWIPFCGACTREKECELTPKGISDVYTWRASYLPALNVDSQFAQTPNENFDNLRFGIAEWKKVSPYLLKEFYPLTPWHHKDEKDGFTAYAFFDPETESGALLAFRQEDCKQTTLSLHLPFAKTAGFIFTDEDTRYAMNVQKGELLSITFDAPRTAKLFFFTKTNS